MPLDRRTFLSLAGTAAAGTALARVANATEAPRVVRAADVRSVRRAPRGDASLSLGSPGRCASRRGASWHGGYALADVTP